MATPQVQILLGSVRRRLWRDQLVAAIRLALWVSAGLLLVAVAVQLSVRRVPAVTILPALAVLWTVIFAWVGCRRPSDGACALWADRHLGGASAFTTMLDAGKAAHPGAQAPAVLWLEVWATARVPQCLRLIDERGMSARLSRPLLSVVICTALAAFVLALPDPTSPSRKPGAPASASAGADGPTPMAEAPESVQLLSDIASALRSAESNAVSERSAAGQRPGAGIGVPASVTDSLTAAPEGVAPQGENAAAGESLLGTPADAAHTAGKSAVAGASPGRDAGDSRDDRADVGVSRMLQGTMAKQKLELKSQRPSPLTQVDPDQSASYDEQFSMPGVAALRTDIDVAAATPPPATEVARLTPTEASYVQAWMKARARR
jgi:hypothetical protein